VKSTSNQQYGKRLNDIPVHKKGNNSEQLCESRVTSKYWLRM
jgi:hypothetical protein